MTEDELTRKRDTSKEAEESIDGDAARLRMIVLEEIRKSEKHGRTCDEIEVRLRLRHQTCSPRVTELADRKAIYDSGLRRKTRSGRNAIVWVSA